MASSIAHDLFYISLGSNSNPAIVLLHGIFCSHLEFVHVSPYLADYHVILVDLPGHSRSAATPFSLLDTIDKLAMLIEHVSPAGKAHVVGLSFGGFIALQLARRHPERTLSVFASGATPFRGVQRWLAEHPWALYPIVATLVKWMPDWLYWWMSRRAGLVRHEELRLDMRSNLTYGLLTAGYRQLAELDMEDIAQIKAVKTAVVAGGQQDDVEGTRAVGRLIKENCPGSKAYVVRAAIHGWDLQYPELFAQGVMAWIEGKNMPKEYEEIE